MKHAFFIFLLACIAAPFASATMPDEQFAEANAQYEAGEYEQAAESYLKLLPAHQSANLHYNLGNAYYQLGDYGPAILHYEKALALDPRNPDVRANLELTQEAAELTPPAPSWAMIVADRASANVWAWLAAISFWLTLALLFLAPMYRWKGPLRGGLTTLAIAVLITSAIALYGWHVQSGFGVVLTDEAKLSVAPTETSPSAGSVKAGQLAYIRKQHGEYYLVTLGDKVGWLERKQFAPIWDRT